MVACTLDYEWPTYVVASLISLFGGLFIILLVRYACRWSGRLRAYNKHLLSVQQAADGILAGDSVASKTFVSVDGRLYCSNQCNSVTMPVKVKKNS